MGTFTKKTEKLEKMMGKFFTHHQHGEVKFNAWKAHGENVIIETSAGTVKTSFYDLTMTLQEYKPLPGEEETIETSVAISNRMQPVNSISSSVMPGNVVADLRDTLLDNIKRVQADSSYIPQAVQISKTVDSLINLARLELDYKTKL